VADQDQHAVAPALLAAATSLERVVVGEEQALGAGALRGLHELGDRGRAVGIGRMDVRYARQAVEPERVVHAAAIRAARAAALPCGDGAPRQGRPRRAG
jgi:hypothetical protein